ncbi:MAG: crotonase/enoyl-CoA hydratase family protein [Deltaproteobacteria bacterium]|nr:crotonase/enoyl-CoA hydratase family protein [Deltaproteobacteria bacterium]
MDQARYLAFDRAVADHVATVTLRGPGKGNAMGPDFWRECPQLFSELGRDDEVRVVLLRGSGAAFCYGLDLLAMAGELGALAAPGAAAVERARLLDVIEGMQRALHAVFSCKKPVVAAVHGWCIGGGLDLAAAADLRVCSGGARFSLREVKLAIVADVGSLQYLPHLIGEAATRELAFTGKDIDANRALALGLVSEVFADDDALFSGAHRLAQQIADNPPLVVQGIKRVMNRRIEGEIASGLREVAAWNAAFLGTEDLGEAVAAFAERRPARFTGR